MAQKSFKSVDEVKKHLDSKSKGRYPHMQDKYNSTWKGDRIYKDQNYEGPMKPLNAMVVGETQVVGTDLMGLMGKMLKDLQRLAREDAIRRQKMLNDPEYKKKVEEAREKAEFKRLLKNAERPIKGLTNQLKMLDDQLEHAEEKGDKKLAKALEKRIDEMEDKLEEFDKVVQEIKNPKTGKKKPGTRK